MSSYDPDDALRAAARSGTSDEARKTRERSAVDQRVADYRADRKVIEDRLVRTGERVLERLLAAPGRGGIEAVLVERSFMKKTRMDGWMLRSYPRGGGLLLLASGELVSHGHVYPSDRFGIEDRWTFAEWIDKRLAEATGGGEKPPPEEWYLKRTTIWYGDESMGRSLRGSLQQIEREVMDLYLGTLRRAGVSL